MAQTTSGTYAFSPSVGEVAVAAFDRIGIAATDISARHISSFVREANLLNAKWSNKGPNLWTVDLQSVTLIEGQESYSVPSNTVMVLDAYITTTDSSGNATDRIILPISRSEYATYPNKAQQAPPTVYWFDRLIAPTITLWPVPDGATTYTLNYYRFRQMQDAAIAGGALPEIPLLWLDAFVAEMAHRMARIFALPLEAIRKGDADEAYLLAAEQNTENTPLFVAPMLGGYYRR